MNPILATNLFSIGKKIINKVTSDFSSTSRACQSQFSNHLNSLEKTESSVQNHNLKLQKLEISLKSELLKDPKTANFFQQNQSNQIFWKKEPMVLYNLFHQAVNIMYWTKTHRVARLLTNYSIFALKINLILPR